MNDLLAMIPEWFKKIIEFPEIMKAWAKGLDMIEGDVSLVWNNQYIQTCDEATLSQYERLLGITPAGDLNYRREIVINRLSLSAPFSVGFLRQQLNARFGEDGYTFNVDPQTSTAEIVITAPVERAVSIFLDLWYEVAPAHIEISVQEVSFVEGNMLVGGAVGSYVTHSF